MNLTKRFFERYPDTVLPIFFLCLYIVFFYTAGQYLLANIDAVMMEIRSAYAVYGLWMVLIGGFLETLFMIGIYIPASLTIAFAIVIDPTFPNVFFVGIVCILAALLANLFNFAIGKYGLVKFFNFMGAEQILNAQNKKQNSYKSILLSAVNPNLLGTTVVYHAAKGMSFYGLISLSVLSTMFWVPTLSYVVIIIGEKFFTKSSAVIFLLLCAAWVIYLIMSQEVQNYLEKKRG